MEIEELTDPGALDAIAPEWADLWKRCPGAHCFQRPEWLLPWTRQFFRGERIWSIAIRHDGRLAGLAPLFIHRHRDRFETRQVSFLGAGISDYLGFLLEPEIAHTGFERILQHLAGRRDIWDVCDLQELPPDSPVLSATCPGGLYSASGPCSTCPVITLPAESEALDNALRGRFKNLRRTIHQLERDPEAEFTIATPETYRDHLEELFRLHRSRWQDRRETGMLITPELRRFHLEAAAGFAANGMLRMFGLRYAGEMISVWYGFAASGRYYAYLTGFDPNFARLSPGQVLLDRSLRAAVAEGVPKYDFLRKTEDFKHRWGAEDSINHRVLYWHEGSRLPDSQEFLECTRGMLATV